MSEGLKRVPCKSDRLIQVRQVTFNGFPDDTKVHFVIAVRQHVAHVMGKRQRQFGVGSHEVRRNAFNVAAGFSNDLEVADDGILDQWGGEESCFVEVCAIVLDAVDGFQNEVLIIRQAQRITAHTGRASAITA